MLGLFLLALTFSTLFSIYLLPFALIAAPLAYGIPHLWASYRFVPYGLGLRSSLRLLVGVAVIGSGLAFWRPDAALENAGIWIFLYTLAFAGFLRLAGKRNWWRAIFIAPLIVLPLVISSLTISPIMILAALMLTHNFVAFIYWYKASKNGEEQFTSLAALTFLLFVCAAILLGHVDSAIASVPLGFEIPEDVTSFLNFSGSFTATMRWLCVFSISQSIHYFIWLKALGDQHLKSENPTSFRRAFENLKFDFGNTVTVVAIVSTVLFWTYALVETSQARSLYLLLSGSHAYWEIAALPYLFATDKIE